MSSRRNKRRLSLKPFLATSAVLLIAAAALSQGKAPKPPDAYVDEIAPLCREWGEELPLILAVIQTESRFREDARSAKGAVGLMQVMPDTGRWMAEQLGLEGYADDKLPEKEWNLIIGIAYMSYLRRQFPGSLAQALAAYNAGPNRVRAWMNAGDWDGGAGRLEDIPYAETRKYVRKVLKTYEDYRKIYLP